MRIEFAGGLYRCPGSLILTVERPNNTTRTEIEAAAFRGLVEHLQRRRDVHTIDLNLTGFCRNCLSRWYLAETREMGLAMTYDDAREVVYGITYQQWKDLSRRIFGINPKSPTASNKGNQYSSVLVSCSRP